MSRSMKKTAQQLGKAFGLGMLSILPAMPVYAAENAPQHRIISLQAEASREVQNDQMEATLYTELTNANPALLAKDINDSVNKAMTAARDYPAVKITSGNQNTYPIYNDKNKLTSWRGRASVQLKSRDFKATSELVAQLQSRMLLENVNFSVSNEQRKTVENELMTELTQNFRQRAGILQSAWGANGYELVQMDINTNSDEGRPPIMFARAASMKMESDGIAPQEVSGGNSRIRVTAQGSIQLNP